MKRRILLASTNPGKLAELSELLGTVGEKIDWDSLSNYGNIPEVVEDGDTFAENARKKALGYAKATGLWTIADDSGLVIDALGGKPGVYSARYAADECPDSNRKAIDIANYKKVLAELKDTPDAKRCWKPRALLKGLSITLPLAKTALAMTRSSSSPN
ncbi:MAG: non-canonical purine NTP pyrophosphatase [Planctomycetota bacterium]